MIGVLRYYNDELYAMPEIVKPVEPKWLVARKFELEDEYGKMYETSKAYDGYDAQTRESPKAPAIQEPVIQMTNNFQNKKISSFAEPKETQKEAIISEEEKIDEIKIGDKFREPGVRDKIFDLIKAADADGGLDIDKIIMALKEPVDQINKEITEL